MKKIEHFKSMIKAIKDKKALAGKLVDDLADSNSQKEVSDDDLPVNKENVMNKANMKKAVGAPTAPNTWFHHDHPEHGKIEVSAHIPTGAKSHKDVTIHGVGAPGDVHVHPEHDAGMSPKHIDHLKQVAFKHGPGQHMKKSEEMAKSENPHSAGSSDKEVNHVIEHSDFQGEHQYRGHAIQVMKHPETGTHVAHIHDMQHPGADVGEGHLDSTKPHATHEAAHETGKKWIDHHLAGKFQKSEENMKEYTAQEIILQALKNVKEKQDLAKAEEMKREEGKAEDTGSIYNEEQEITGSNEIAEAAKRDQGQAQAKKLKEFVEKAKNKSEKAAKAPKKEEK